MGWPSASRPAGPLAMLLSQSGRASPSPRGPAKSSTRGLNAFSQMGDLRGEMLVEAHAGVGAVADGAGAVADERSGVVVLRVRPGRRSRRPSFGRSCQKAKGRRSGAVRRRLPGGLLGEATSRSAAFELGAPGGSGEQEVWWSCRGSGGQAGRPGARSGGASSRNWRRQGSGVSVPALSSCSLSRRCAGPGCGRGPGKGIGLELVAPRELGKDRRDEEAEHRHHHQEEQQRQASFGAQRGWAARRGRDRSPANWPTTPAAQSPRLAANIQAMRLVMCGGLSGPSSCASTASTLAGLEFAEQRVKKHHALGRPEAAEKALPCAERLLPSITKRPLDAKPQRCIRASTRAFQGLVGQRRELVEERRDDGGVEQHQQQLKPHPHAPGPQPPAAAGHPISHRIKPPAAGRAARRAAGPLKGRPHRSAPWCG